MTFRMVFCLHGGVVPVLARSHRLAMLPHCAPRRLALNPKSAFGGEYE